MKQWEKVNYLSKLKAFEGEIMKKLFILIFSLLVIINVHASVLTCPDPLTSSLKSGVLPPPWLENPFSPNRPQSDDNTIFLNAAIMLRSDVGRGAICNYKNTVGIFSLWYPGYVKVPAPQDYSWINTAFGFLCSGVVADCLLWIV